MKKRYLTEDGRFVELGSVKEEKKENHTPKTEMRAVKSLANFDLKELKDMCDEKKIQYAKNATKEKILTLLENSEKECELDIDL